MSSDEYEVVPTSPIRRLEKRLEKMEDTSTGSQSQKLVEQIIELIKSNQRVIDDVIKANAELRDELSRIPGKIDQLLTAFNDFMGLIKQASQEEAGGGVGPEAFKPLTEKMTELVDQNKKSLESDQAIVAGLDVLDKRLKRLYMGFANMYRR